jgi:hypothetical protein
VGVAGGQEEGGGDQCVNGVAHAEAEGEEGVVRRVVNYQL